MHHIHRTKGLVLQNRPIKEADLYITILTEDLGVIRATAQGSRKMESKMRQSIQEYSISNLALVSGRTGWRLVNASFIKNVYNELHSDALREVVCMLCGFVERFIVDELEDRDIFEIMELCINWAIDHQHDVLVETENIQSFEAICLCRILHNLGYLQEGEGILYFITEPLSSELIQTLVSGHRASRKDLVLEINRAIRDSHL